MPQPDALPPPGGMTAVIIHSLAEFELRECYLLHPDLFWMSWSQALDSKTFILPEIRSLVLLTGILSQANVDKICKKAQWQGIKDICIVNELDDLIRWVESLLPEQQKLKTYLTHYEPDTQAVRDGHQPRLPSVLMVGFLPSDLSKWSVCSAITWWTPEEAENKTINRSSLRNGIRFVIINGRLREFTRERHRQSANSVLSSESVLIAMNEGEVHDWLAELDLETIDLEESPMEPIPPRRPPQPVKPLSPKLVRVQAVQSEQDQILKKICLLFGLTRAEFLQEPTTSPAKLGAVLAMRRTSTSFMEIGNAFSMTEKDAKIAALAADIEVKKNGSFRKKVEMAIRLLQNSTSPP